MSIIEGTVSISYVPDFLKQKCKKNENNTYIYESKFVIVNPSKIGIFKKEK